MGHDVSLNTLKSIYTINFVGKPDIIKRYETQERYNVDDVILCYI